MIRETVVAGRFYEANAGQLKSQIEGCLQHRLGAAASIPNVGGTLAGIIVPHAGYVFSGPVATHAFARLQREIPPPDTVVLLGPKHTRYGESFSVSAASAWKTPLGQMEVDSGLRDKVLASDSLFRPDNDAHAFEHSIEVQLPFLQYFMSPAPRILPIAIHYAPFASICKIADGLRKVIAGETAKKIIFLVSSDFSHDTPREQAYKLDREVIDLILSNDAEGVYKLITEEDRSVCGVMPICTMLQIFADASLKATLLKYATSMDIMRHELGVGYAAIIFEK